MNLIKKLTVIIILLGLIISVVIVYQTSGRAKLLVTIPYLVMLAVLSLIFKKQSKPSIVGYFIAVTIVCIFLNGAFYSAAFNTGSSTDGLVFVIAPFSSLVILFVLYIVCTWLAGVIFFHHNNKGLLKTGLVIIASIAAFNWFSSFFKLYTAKLTVSDEASRSTRPNFTDGDIAKSKKLGAFVKELHFRVDSFTGPVNFTPYIEKPFRYLDEDSTKIELVKNGFSVQFQRKAVEGAYIETRNYHEYAYCPCLSRPELDDTLIYNIKRDGQELGTIKVWD